MSLLNTINSPSDMLKKLFREANEMAFEDDIERMSDLVANFSITSDSIREWCVSYQNQLSNKKALVAEWDMIPCLKAAKDIANSTKHVQITRYVPTVSGVNSGVSKTLELYMSHDISKELEEVKSNEVRRGELERDAPSFNIEFTDGRSISLHKFYSDTVREWLNYFDSNSIPRSPNLKATLIYMNRSLWPEII